MPLPAPATPGDRSPLAPTSGAGKRSDRAARPSRAERTSRGPLASALAVVLATVGCAPPRPQAPADAAEASRGHVAVDGARGLSVLRSAPAPGPRVILVHGTPGAASGWVDYVLDPPDGLEVLAPDRPGFGDSGPAGAVPALADQAAALAALLPAPPRRAVLVGHSLGGPIVAWLASEHPDRVQGIVLLAASLDPAQERIHPLQRLGAWWPVQTMLPRALRNANAELMALAPELQALQARLPQVRARVVIVHGTDDDLVPVANVPYMQRHLTGAACVHTVLLPGRNHFLPWNSADALRDAVHLAASEGTC